MSEEQRGRTSRGVGGELRSHDPDDFTVTEGNGDDVFVKADQTVLLMDETQAELLAEALNDYLRDGTKTKSGRELEPEVGHKGPPIARRLFGLIGMGNNDE